MYKSKNIEVLPESTHGNSHIRFTDGPFCGIVFNLGEVTFSGEDDEEATMSYHYDIITNPFSSLDKEEFERYVGDLLIDLIKEQLEANDLIYTGGVDSENRTNDIEQSDHK